MIHGAIIDGTDKQNMIRRKRSDHKDGLKPTITDRNLSLFCLDVDGFDCPGGIFDLDAIKYFIGKPTLLRHMLTLQRGDVWSYIQQRSTIHDINIRNLKPAPVNAFKTDYGNSYWVGSI